MKPVEMIFAAIDQMAIQKQAGTGALTRGVNRLWNSNAGGAALAGGLGYAEHELATNLIPGAENMSPIGNVASQGLASVLPALITTPFGRQLMMRGRGKALLDNASKPLLGPGRVKMNDFDPKKLFGVGVPKTLAVMGVPVLDNLTRSVSSIPNIGKSLEGAAGAVQESAEGVKGFVDSGNKSMFGDGPDDNGIFGSLSDGAGSLATAAGGVGEAGAGAGNFVNTLNSGVQHLGKLRDVGTGALGAGAGYIAGGLAGDMFGQENKPARSKRIKALLQAIGAGIGGYTGYGIMDKLQTPQ
jgi:hypothetical protein